MIIFKDVVTGDEMLSDSFKPVLSDCKTHYTFHAKFLKKQKDDIDGSLIGANASSEEAQEELETGSESGFDFVFAHHLKKVELGEKKEYQKFLKAFFKRQLERVVTEKPDEVAEFKAGAAKLCSLLYTKYGDSDVYFGENDYELKGTFCQAIWNDDGVSATVYVCSSGLLKEKY